MISTVFRALLFLLCLSLPSLGSTQTRATGDGFDLTANDAIRFDADAAGYEASGDVQLVVGPWVVLADQVTARLDPSQTRVTTLGARGKVFIQQDGFRARAAAADLDLSTQGLRLSGAPVNLQLGEDRLITDGAVVFAVEQGTVTIEDAFVLQLDGTSFSGGRAQAQVMGDRVQTVSVVGGVQLEGPSVKLAADRLALDRESGSLRLEGGVVVQSGGVLLSGAAAVYDLATGTVALSNDDAQRVTGVLSFQ